MNDDCLLSESITGTVSEWRCRECGVLREGFFDDGCLCGSKNFGTWCPLNCLMVAGEIPFFGYFQAFTPEECPEGCLTILGDWIHSI